MIPIIVILIVVLLIVYWCIRTVNDFKRKEIRVQEGLSGVEVALTKRYDMLTKMLDTAKGYMTHESELFEKVIALRRGMSIAEMNDAQQQMDALSGKFLPWQRTIRSCAPAMFSQSFSGESATRKSICRRRGGCITAMSPPTTRRLPCSRQSFWQARASRRNSSSQTQASAKMSKCHSEKGSDDFGRKADDDE